MRHTLPLALAVSAGCLFMAGCTTEAAKKAMNKPAPKEKYSGFDPDAADQSKRAAPRPEKLNPDADPETAVDKLVEQLQKDRAHAVYAEEQLRYWGSKQGVDKMVVSRVRLLLKNPSLEVRAPALRLTMQFGGNEVNGDLVEVLADSEYGMRQTAFRALKARTSYDFGYTPSGGEVARAKSVEQWRQWWQQEQARLAVKDPSIYEMKPISEPHIEKSGEKPKDKGKASDKDRELSSDADTQAEADTPHQKKSKKEPKKAEAPKKVAHNDDQDAPAEHDSAPASSHSDNTDPEQAESRLLLNGKE